MRYFDAFPSRFLKADDLDERDLTVTIKDCQSQDFTDPKTKEGSTKPVLYFTGEVKPLILNKTNFNTISKVFGSDDSDDWKHKQITLFGIEVESFGEMTLTIRVRVKKNSSTKTEYSEPPPDTSHEDKLPF